MPVVFAILVALFAAFGHVRNKKLINPYIHPLWLLCCSLGLVVVLMVVPWLRFWCRKQSEAEALDTSAWCKAYFLRARARFAQGQLALADSDICAAEAITDDPDQIYDLEQLACKVAKAYK